MGAEVDPTKRGKRNEVDGTGRWYAARSIPDAVSPAEVTLLENTAAHHVDGHRLPKFVEQEFQDFLRGGVLAHGFARLRCGDCAFERFVPLSCKGRGFCPNCGAGALPSALRVSWTASYRMFRYLNVRFEFLAQLLEIINLAVEHHPHGPGLVRHRLMTGGKIDGRQAAEAEPEGTVDVLARVVRAPVHDGVHHALDGARIDGEAGSEIILSADAAHGSILSAAQGFEACPAGF
jgi:hypothetical protein